LGEENRGDHDPKTGRNGIKDEEVGSHLPGQMAPQPTTLYG